MAEIAASAFRKEAGLLATRLMKRAAGGSSAQPTATPVLSQYTYKVKLIIVSISV